MEFTAECLKEGQKVIIYGASVYGELALRGLEQLEIVPLGFADRALGGRSYLGYPVLKPNELSKYREECILIASADFYYEIFNFLESIDCGNVYDISSLLKLHLDEGKLSNRAKEMYHARENYFLAVEATDLTIIHLGFCVSEKCSLRCKDCSFLMPYYEQPQNIDLDYYKPALDRFLETIDYIAEFRIYGGEPFMNPAIYKLLEWYHDCPKINTLSIYTNGTIIPDRLTLESMKKGKVKVHISDYQHNEKHVRKLTEILQEEGITYFIRRYDVWQQAGNLECREYSVERMEEIYGRCFATNCYSFLKGKFYVCPRAAHAVNLGAIHDEEEDRVDFTDQTVSIEELRKQLRDLMHNRKWIEACRYCDGLDNHGEGVEPAVQIRDTLRYDRLTKD